MSKKLTALASQARACTQCAHELDAGVRPVFQVGASARVLIAGQAPGSKVHATGIPFDDPSGERLRDWMGIDRDTFYDDTRIAILPMAFCYPGRGKSGDLPPMPRCADAWREAMLDALPNIELTLVIGQYAQAWHLDDTAPTLTQTVRAWDAWGESIIPLPHPSPRNNIWMKKNPWFARDVVPAVRNGVRAALG